MKLIYIVNARMPTEKAHGIQIMKMCEAFADSGVEVELVLPQRFNFIKDNPFKYYGIKKNFKPEQLIFKEKDPEDLKDKILNIFKMREEEKEKLGKNLRELVVQNHSINRLVDTLIHEFYC